MESILFSKNFFSLIVSRTSIVSQCHRQQRLHNLKRMNRLTVAAGARCVEPDNRIYLRKDDRSYFMRYIKNQLRFTTSH